MLLHPPAKSALARQHLAYIAPLSISASLPCLSAALLTVIARSKSTKKGFDHNCGGVFQNRTIEYSITQFGRQFIVHFFPLHTLAHTSIYHRCFATRTCTPCPISTPPPSQIGDDSARAGGAVCGVVLL